MDLEQTAIERLRFAAEMSLRVYKQPLVITYSGGKDSDVLLHLAGKAGIQYEVLHSLTTADAPETVWHVRDTFRHLELAGVKCTIDTHRTSDGGNVTMWNLIPRKLMPPTRLGIVARNSKRPAGVGGGSRPAFAGPNRKSASPAASWRPCTGTNPSG